MADLELRRTLVSDAIYKALRQYDEGKRLVRDVRMATRSAYPAIKRGTGRASLTFHLTNAVLAALDEMDARG